MTMTPEEIEEVIDHILLEVSLSPVWQPFTVLTGGCADSTGKIPTSLLAFLMPQAVTSMTKL